MTQLPGFLTGFCVQSRSCGNAKNGLGRDGSTEDREDEEMGIEQDVASCPKKRIKDRLHTIAYQEKKRRLNEGRPSVLF